MHVLKVASVKRTQLLMTAFVLTLALGSLYYANSSLAGSQPKGTVSVLYAGSFVNTMEGGIGPAFVTMGYNYKGEGHGSVQNANFVIDDQRSPDVFVSAGIPPIQMLLINNPPLAKWYVVFASDEIVIAYSDKSQFVDLFNKASKGILPWYEILAKPQVKFLRTDPEQDPKGYYMIMVAKLANSYYGNSSISSLILRGDRNPNQIRPEEILSTLLENGECDAVPLYKHEAVERGLPFITLPQEINLGNPAYSDSYEKASYTLGNKTVHGQPIVFAVTIPTTAKDMNSAMDFVTFLLSGAGQQILSKHGFSLVHYTAGGDVSAVPPEIAVIVNS
jgi:molybdate/tungstate transport system substrate-binding protein